VGALAGAFFLAARPSVVGLGRVIATASGTFGAALIALGLSRALWLSLLIMPLIGAGFMVSLAASNTIIQTLTEEHLRGRVMAFYTMAFLGTAPLGSLLAGVLADRIGEPATIAAGGAVCILGAAWFASRLPRLRELIRPIYIERGILAPHTAQTGGSSARRVGPVTTAEREEPVG
jgi:MFS family permease